MIPNKTPRSNSLTSYHRSFFLALFVFFITFSSVFALDDAILFYDFEDGPDSTFTDVSNISVDANNTGSPYDVTAISGDWAFYGTSTDYSIGEVNTSYYNGSGYLTTNRTYVFWIYGNRHSAADRHMILSDGANGLIDTTNAGAVEIRAHMASDSNDALEIAIRESGVGYQIYTTPDNSLNPSQWNHIAVLIRNTTGGNLQTYINGDPVTATLTLSNPGASTAPSAGAGRNDLYIGNFGSVQAISTSSSGFFLDDVGIYDRHLSESEVEQLYGGGTAFNPYRAEPPTQIASIANVQLGTQESVSVNYGDFFLSETNITFTFAYDSASYEAYYPVDANTGDFYVDFTDIGSVTWYSYSAQVPQTPINITASNSAGSTTVTTYFSVSGFGVPTQLASIDDIFLSSTGTVSRTFSDYFSGYTRRFVQYVDPDDGVTVVNVTNGFPDTNSCFAAEIIGDVVTFTGQGVVCDASLTFIVDDEVTSATSNAVTLIVNATAATRANDFWGDVLSIFPDSDTLTTSAKVGIILGMVLFTAVLFVLMISNAANTGATVFLGMGLGITIVLEIILFTALGYIPVWMTAIVFILGAIISTAFVYERFVPR